MSDSDPWKTFADRHHRGEQITSQISRIVSDIGLFVALEGGIEGIVHLSDLDSTRSGEAAITQYRIGDRIDVVILSIRADLQRVSLGIKQLGQDLDEDGQDGPAAPEPTRPSSPKQPKPNSAGAITR